MPSPLNDQTIRTHFISPRQIVLATDLTDTEELLPHIWAQAKACRASVSLVHAIRTSPIERPEQTLEEEIYARGLLGEMRHALETDGVPCSLIVRKGAAAELVGREIARTRAGRLLIGTHLHGSCGQDMIGTVANSLLLTATVPVFVIPSKLQASLGHARPRKILHPVILSGCYRESMCFAAEIAHACKAELTLLHVMPPSSSTGLYANALETRTRHLVEDSIWPPDLHVRSRLEYGDPVQTILQFSASEEIDWIVMGINHDFPWWSKQNSHTYQVIAESGHPVLTFHNRILAPAPAVLASTEELQWA